MRVVFARRTCRRWIFQAKPPHHSGKTRRIVRHRARSTWGKTSENRRAARHHRVCFSGGNASCHDVVHAVSIGRCRVTVTCAKSSDIAIVVSAAIAPVPLFSLRLILARKQLAVEYDSDSFHIGPDRIAKDAQRRNALEHLDVKVITATSQTCRDPQQLNAISRMIARRLDHAIRPRCRDYERKQHMLRANLFNNPPWL